MKLTDKYLGIEQAITFKALDELFYRYFADEEISDAIIKKYLQEDISGENRLKKALSITRVVLKSNQEILIKIKKGNFFNYAQLSEIDRKTLIIIFLCLTYPVIYKIISMFGTGFFIYDKINKKYIEEKLAAFYGSNSGMFNAIKSVLKILTNFELLKNQKKDKGNYSKPEKWKITNPLIKELIIYCEAYYSISQTIPQNEVGYKPIFNFFEYSNINSDKFIFLEPIVLRESDKYYRIKKNLVAA